MSALAASPINNLPDRKQGEVFSFEMGTRVTREVLTKLLETEPLTDDEVGILRTLLDLKEDQPWAPELARRIMDSSDFRIMSSEDSHPVLFVSWNGNFKYPDIELGNDRLAQLHNVTAYSETTDLGGFVTVFNFDHGGRNALLIFKREH